MSCRPEAVLGAYVDGGLSAAETRALETHLVGCQRCRRGVVALREEAALLSAALCGKLPRDTAPAVVAGPARALWTGLPLCLAAVLAASGVLSFLFEARLPAGFNWLHPARLMGVNDMMWNLLQLLRNEASGWLQLAVGLGAVASLAAMGSFLAGALLRRVVGTTALALLLFAGTAGFAPPAGAAPEFRMDEEGGRLARDLHGVGHKDAEESEHIRVAPGERVEGALYATGETVTVEGEVDGDVFAFTERLTLEGEVDGDVFAFAERITILGVVSGNVLALGETIDLSGEVRGSVFSAGERIELNGAVQRSVHATARDIRVGESAKIGRDVSAAARRLEVEGMVARDLSAAVGELQFSGELGRDLSAVSDEIAILDGARVGGDISALMEDVDELQIASGAQVAGEVRKRVREETVRPRMARYASWDFYLWKLLWLGAAFAMGLLLHALLPGLFRVEIRDGSDFGSSLLLGFAAFVVTPIACLILIATWIGFPIAALGAALLGAAWYLSNLVLAVLIGRWLLRHTNMAKSGELLEFGVVLLLGLLVWSVLRSLPFVGIPLRLVLIPLGVGLLIRHGYAHWRASRGMAPATAPSW